MKSKEVTIPSYLKDDSKVLVKSMASRADDEQAHPKCHLLPEIGLCLSRCPLLPVAAGGLSPAVRSDLHILLLSPNKLPEAETGVTHVLGVGGKTE